MTLVTEGAATILASDGAITRKLEVFYNPVMQVNRDLTVLLLSAAGKKGMRLADPLAGSGIRTIRLLKELPEGMVGGIMANDGRQNFSQVFQDNAVRSELSPDALAKVWVSCDDANRALSSGRFDYIDIDPFGSPNPFLDTAVQHLAPKGILAVTATDTAPLCGTYPKACFRKYWATPKRDHAMHEWGLRILIRKCQLVAGQHELALTPLFSYSHEHYFRVFFQAKKGKIAVDALIDQHQVVDGVGPLWTGPLWDIEVVERMLALAKEKLPGQERLLATILGEARIPAVGFFDVHGLSSELKLSAPPRHEAILAALHKRDILAARTHFDGRGVRAACVEETLKNILRQEVHS